jgi:hypothetical protein
MGCGTASLAMWVTTPPTWRHIPEGRPESQCDGMLTKRRFKCVCVSGSEQAGCLHWRTGLSAAVATQGNLAASVFVYMCLTVFLPVSWCLRSMAKRRSRVWLLILCLRQCNLFIHILERYAQCGGGNVAVSSQ